MGYIKTNSKPLDPYYNNVVFQSSFEYGSDGDPVKYSHERVSGNIYDESKYILQSTGKSMPYLYPDIGTGAYITSSDKAVGNNSLYLTGKTSVTVDNSASGFANNFNFYTGDFTVEFWYKWSGNSSTTWQPVCGIRDNLGGWHCGLRSSSARYYIYFYNGLYGGPIEYWPGRFTTGSSLAYGSRFVTGVWNHLAFSRRDRVIRAFFNGELQQTGNDTTSYFVSYGGESKIGSFHIGGLPTINMYYSGWVDNIRITSGIARYSGNFTPPTDPFLNTYTPISGNTNPKWENTNKKSKNALTNTSIRIISGNNGIINIK